MEKKKILLVAVSVGIFLVIAIGAAILIFSSRNGVSTNAVVMERSNQDTYQPFPSGEDVPVYPRITEEPEDALFPVTPDPAYPFSQSPSGTSGGAAGTGAGASGTSARGTGAAGTSAGAAGTGAGTVTQNNFYINGETSGRNGGETRPQSYPQSRVEARGNERATPAAVIINIPKPESARPLIPSETPQAAPPQAQDRTALPPAKPAAVPPARSPAAKQPASSKPAAVPRTAKPAASARKTYDAYWVQAGSFSTRTHADGAKETLASKGITSIIENQELGGKTFYRVRIGPYISQNEADYWLALVQALGGFEESLVWRNQAQILN